MEFKDLTVNVSNHLSINVVYHLTLDDDKRILSAEIDSDRKFSWSNTMTEFLSYCLGEYTVNNDLTLTFTDTRDYMRYLLIVNNESGCIMAS